MHTIRCRIVDAYRDEVKIVDICRRFAIGSEMLRKILAEEGVEPRGNITALYLWPTKDNRKRA